MTDANVLAQELRAMHAQLGEVIDHVIGIRAGTDEFAHENFEDALIKLRSVRICLDDEATKLCPGGAQ